MAQIDCTEGDGKEAILLMASPDDREPKNESKNSKIWYLDSGCRNHMCGNKNWFIELNEDFRITVKLGNNTRMQIMSKGNVKLKINGISRIVSDVYYIPELKNNLVSIG